MFIAMNRFKPNFRSLDLKTADYQRLGGHFQI